MFTNTIDKKQIITDQDGNQIVDLTTSIFKTSAAGIQAYNTVRLTEYFQMRADKVAFNEYKTDEGTEYILKFSGISNPFSLDKDDVLIIPNMDEADAQMTDLSDEQSDQESQVKLYYKFTNTNFKSSATSYEALANKKIPSGVLDPTDNSGTYIVPYISNDGETAITIKNGRMYFGDSKQPKQTTSHQAELDKNCLTNGMSLSDFVTANTTKSAYNSDELSV